MNPTCFVRFDDQGTTVVWTLCPGCAADIIIHPRAGEGGAAAVAWYDIVCTTCWKTPRELGYGPQE